MQFHILYYSVPSWISFLAWSYLIRPCAPILVELSALCGNATMKNNYLKTYFYDIAMKSSHLMRKFCEMFASSFVVIIKTSNVFY